MLIVPSDQRIDWRRPAWVTLLLAISCILVFATYQSGDMNRSMEAVGFYLDSGLYEYEADLLASEQGVQLPDDPAARTALASQALSPSFDQAVESAWQSEPPSSEWRELRSRFTELRDSLSWVRFGLQPSDVSASALLAHMFLHGGIAHLLGNLVFLLLFGFALERVVGSVAFSAIYILGGLASAGLFVLVNAGSAVPMIGASGAISALMGAFLGVYGMRRMRFFYTVGFWFGEFAAPALLVFPLWLLKELYGYYLTDSPVAYMAHAGGLVGGLLLGLVFRARGNRQLDADASKRESGARRKRRQARIQELITEMRLQDALHEAKKALRDEPGFPGYWSSLRNVAERLPMDAGYHEAMRYLFLNAGNKAMPPGFVLETLDAYKERAGERSASAMPALAGKPASVVVGRFFREGRSADVDRQLEFFVRTRLADQSMRDLIEELMTYANRNKDRRRVMRYREYLERIG